MDIQGFLPARQNVADHFRRGQSVLARVLGSPESGVYQLSIRNQVFQVRSDQPLRSGQYLRLQVLGPQGFALVGSPAADGAATPSPPATTTLGREAALLTMFGLPLLPEFIEHLQQLTQADSGATEGGAFMLARGVLSGPQLSAAIGRLVAGTHPLTPAAQLAAVPLPHAGELVQLLTGPTVPTLDTLRLAVSLLDQMAQQLSAQTRHALASAPLLQVHALLLGQLEASSSELSPTTELSALLSHPDSSEALRQVFQRLDPQENPALARHLLDGLAGRGESTALDSLLAGRPLDAQTAGRLVRLLQDLLAELAQNRYARLLAEGNAQLVAKELIKTALADRPAAQAQLETSLLAAGQPEQAALWEALSSSEQHAIERLPDIGLLRTAYESVHTLQVRLQAQTLLPMLADPGRMMLAVLDLPITPGGPFRRGQFQLLIRRDAAGKPDLDRPRTLYIDVDLTRLGRVEVLGALQGDTANLSFFLDGGDQADFLSAQADVVREGLAALGLSATISATPRKEPLVPPAREGIEHHGEVGGIDVMA